MITPNLGYLGQPLDFFQDVAGSIEIDNITYTVDGFAGGYSFQWGQGGNAKDASEFGGSA